MTVAVDWPPPFTLQRSPRARSVRLQICARRGLRLIVPRSFNPAKALQVLQQHRSWIEKTWLRVQPKLNGSEIEALPQQLELLAIDMIVPIVYKLNDSKITRLEWCADKQLILHGKEPSKSIVKVILQRWLGKQAQHHLIQWLERLSQQTNLSYAKASVRSATTRWGSCSTKKNISLNSKLLFLPPALVEHVLLHELCHTVHLNHSRGFWDLVKSVDANCHRSRKQLKLAQRYIPAWLE